jgi:hypothetical protein
MVHKEEEKLEEELYDLYFQETRIQQLIDQGKIEDVKTYLRKFFFRHQTRHQTDTFFYDGMNSTFLLFDRKGINSLIPNDLVKYDSFRNANGKTSSVKTFDVQDYLNSTEFLENKYYPTIDFRKPMVFSECISIKGHKITKNFINMAKPLGIDIQKAYDREKVKGDLQLVYDHILNVWCSKNEALNTWILNFIACTIAGRKVRKILYSQCSERCGRGTIVKLIMNILGSSAYKTSSVEVVLQYTKPFEGCRFLNFDEMPVDNGNCRSISDKNKSLSTEDQFDCRAMHQTPYPQKNTFNIMITTQNDAVHLTQSNNERYVLTDVDESRKGDIAYFTKLNKAVANEEVQLAFYHDMMERFQTLDNWNEDIMPMSNTRKQKIIEALPRLYKYIKEEYILKQVELNENTVDFFEDYKFVTKDNTSKEKLGRLLTKLNIKPIKVNKTVDKNKKIQYYIYKASWEELKELFEQNNWLDDMTDLDNVNSDNVMYQRDEEIKSLENQMKEMSCERDLWKRRYDEIYKKVTEKSDPPKEKKKNIFPPVIDDKTEGKPKIKCANMLDDLISKTEKL